MTCQCLVFIGLAPSARNKMPPALTYFYLFRLALQDHSPCPPTRQEYPRDRGAGQQVCGQRQEATKWQRHGRRYDGWKLY